MDDGGGSFGDSEKLLGMSYVPIPRSEKKWSSQQKGGIVLGVPYDSSGTYLREAVEKSLTRMGIETIDLYQIHRPDFLGHPAEIASVLTNSKKKEKIKRSVSPTTHLLWSLYYKLI